MHCFLIRTRGLLLVAAAAAAAACGGQASADSSQSAAAAREEYARTINVEVLAAESGDFTEVIRITGTVQANRDVVVSAEESGVIREVMAEKGARVQAGQPIARIDDRILQAQVAQARAQAQLAEELWERRKRLFEQDKVGTELAYLEAKYGAEQAKANHATLAERLARTVIRAPIAGILDSRDIEVGNMVAAGTRVARILQLDTLKVTGGVPERYAPDITRGTALRVSFDVLPARVVEGRVMYAGSAVNPRNRTFPIELSIPNRDMLVKPEMVANIEAVRRKVSGSIAIPQEALVRVEQGFVVFVVESDAGGIERAVAKHVQTGAAQRNRVVIENGISAGDRIVIVGQNQLADGDRVRIVNTLQAGAQR